MEIDRMDLEFVTVPFPCTEPKFIKICIESIIKTIGIIRDLLARAATGITIKNLLDELKKEYNGKGDEWKLDTNPEILKVIYKNMIGAKVESKEIGWKPQITLQFPLKYTITTCALLAPKGQSNWVRDTPGATYIVNKDGKTLEWKLSPEINTNESNFMFILLHQMDGMGSVGSSRDVVRSIQYIAWGNSVQHQLDIKREIDFMSRRSLASTYRDVYKEKPLNLKEMLNKYADNEPLIRNLCNIKYTAYAEIFEQPDGFRMDLNQIFQINSTRTRAAWRKHIERAEQTYIDEAIEAERSEEEFSRIRRRAEQLLQNGEEITDGDISLIQETISSGESSFSSTNPKVSRMGPEFAEFITTIAHLLKDGIWATPMSELVDERPLREIKVDDKLYASFIINRVKRYNTSPFKENIDLEDLLTRVIESIVDSPGPNMEKDLLSPPPPLDFDNSMGYITKTGDAINQELWSWTEDGSKEATSTTNFFKEAFGPQAIIEFRSIGSCDQYGLGGLKKAPESVSTNPLFGRWSKYQTDNLNERINKLMLELKKIDDTSTKKIINTEYITQWKEKKGE
ncbi:MAG: hypothetical protein LBF70_02295 [Holosporales bacterium]|jgi:hypothetical protein|nr:hypothetical protein [Holosporales bacterium]